MKISLLQCDVQDGDLPGNAEKVLYRVKEAAAEGAELCVAPGDILAGPMAGAYMAQDDFRNALGNICAMLAQNLPSQTALLCGPLFFAGGMFMEVPERLFFKGQTFAIIEGNDATGECTGADIYLSMAPRPFYPCGQELSEQHFSALAARENVWILAPNLTGGYGSRIFTGQSFAINAAGKLAGRAAFCEDDTLTIDLTTEIGRIMPLPATDIAAQWQAIVLGLADFCHKSGASRAIIGLSGGMDSALVACIACEALGAPNVTGILMPSPYTSEASIRDALELAKNLDLDTLTLPIESLMKNFTETLEPVLAKFAEPEKDLTFENLQARIRGVLLMAAANRSGALVLNTSNKSELAMGYSTLYGDTAGAVAVIGDLLKTRVYELARWYCGQRGQIIPQNIFDRAPSAELRPNQKDSDSLPPYDRLDPMLMNLLRNETFNASQNQEEESRLRRKVFSCQFKRAQCPPPLLVTGDSLASFAAPICGIYKTGRD